MTIEELDLHIKHVDQQTKAARADWEALGCFWARGQADKFLMAMDRAIEARSQLQGPWVQVFDASPEWMKQSKPVAVEAAA